MRLSCTSANLAFCFRRADPDEYVLLCRTDEASDWCEVTENSDFDAVCDCCVEFRLVVLAAYDEDLEELPSCPGPLNFHRPATPLVFHLPDSGGLPTAREPALRGKRPRSQVQVPQAAAPGAHAAKGGPRALAE